MPELPEVETTRRGIAPHIEGRKIQAVVIRNRRLRWPISSQLTETLPGQRIHSVERRAKYLLLKMDRGTLILHLGMSGSLRFVGKKTEPQPHDHFDLVFANGTLRLRDPRRFGAVLWTRQPVEKHALLKELGPEPLSEAFDGDHLHRLAQQRRGPVKTFIMDGKVVVGVGNIYANESLFLAGIHPNRASNRIALQRYRELADRIKAVLQAAIQQGGTTLRDFRQEDGQPGYFAQQLRVYGKAGEPCPHCGHAIRQLRIGQRSTFYCPRCQT